MPLPAKPLVFTALTTLLPYPPLGVVLLTADADAFLPMGVVAAPDTRALLAVRLRGVALLLPLELPLLLMKRL